MVKYKEIQPQTYLELDSGKIYFNIDEVLIMINNPFSVTDDKNSISPTQLIRYCIKHNIHITDLSTNNIEFAMFTKTDYYDPNSVNLKSIKTLFSQDLDNLLQILKKSQPTKTRKKKKKFNTVDWGMIEQNDRKEHDLFYSLQRTLTDVMGRKTSTNVTSRIPIPKISQRQLANKVNSILNDNPSNVSGFKKITVKPSQINFGSIKIHATNEEVYINEALYDKILNYFVYNRGINTKGRVDNLDQLRHSTTTVRELLRPYKENLIKDYNDTYYYVTSKDADAIDKQTNKRIDTLIKRARDEFYYDEKQINHQSLELSKFYQNREHLRNILDSPLCANIDPSIIRILKDTMNID